MDYNKSRIHCEFPLDVFFLTAYNRSSLFLLKLFEEHS